MNDIEKSDNVVFGESAVIANVDQDGYSEVIVYDFDDSEYNKIFQGKVKTNDRTLNGIESSS